MTISIRKWVTTVEEIHVDGRPADEPLVKAAVAAIIPNPYAGRWSDTLDELIDPSADLARELVDRCANALGGREAQGMGKGAIVGTDGEQEHGVACVTTPFGDAIRDRIGGISWVSSTSKVAAAGATLDVPLAYKSALFVREFYDTISITIPDGPRPDEIAVIAAMSSAGRLHHRVGGLSKAEATAGDGLR